LKQRFITAALAGVLFLLTAVIGGISFTILITLLALIGFWEFLRMRNLPLLSIPGVAGLLLIALLVPEPGFTPIPEADLFMLAFFLLLLYTVLSKNAFTFDDTAFVLLSILYVGFGFHYLLVTRLEDHGLHLLLFILLVIWSSDSGAYFTGKRIGKKKLLPEISPKKTVEGAAGGIVAALVVSVICQFLFPVYETFGFAMLAAVVISVFGQIGDLVESAFKRHYGVKDSGSLLPGHGGILDRCDSWLFVLPILYLLNFI
jgi:phosphatidate cytidylyltransferase